MPTQPFQRFVDQAMFINAEGCFEDDEAYHSSARSSPISFRTDSVSPPRMDYHLPYPLLPILWPTAISAAGPQPQAYFLREV
jgi:hypothetical protein